MIYYKLLNQNGSWWGGLYDGPVENRVDAISYTSYADAFHERHLILSSGVYPLMRGWRIVEEHTK